MEVIPAIDIRRGKCVRLFQGDFDKEIIFSENPLEVADWWWKKGASRIHIVDLDGSVKGDPQNLHIISDIASSIDIPLQMGGGLRSLANIERVLNMGIDRVVLGTAAVEDPEMLRLACDRFGDTVMVGVDARNGMVAVRGWLEESQLSVKALVRQMMLLGVRRFVYTDIERDGTLTRPDFDGISELVGIAGEHVVASGGVTLVEHVQRLARAGVEAAIIGRALYTGDIDLVEAMQVANES